MTIAFDKIAAGFADAIAFSSGDELRARIVSGRDESVNSGKCARSPKQPGVGQS